MRKQSLQFATIPETRHAESAATRFLPQWTVNMTDLLILVEFVKAGETFLSGGVNGTGESRELDYQKK